MSFERDNLGNDGSPWKLKPWRTILKDKDHGWSPLLWVVYLGFFFVDPVVSHASARIWAVDITGAIVFLFLYFGLFALESPRTAIHIGGMLLLGMLFLPINGGSSTFFIYAAAMLPFCLKTQSAAVLGLVTVGMVGAIEGLLLHLHGWTLFYTAIFPLIIGGGNTVFAERNRMNRKLRKPTRKSNTWPQWPSANALRVTCTMC